MLSLSLEDRNWRGFSALSAPSSLWDPTLIRGASMEELPKCECSPLSFVAIVQLCILHGHPCLMSCHSHSQVPLYGCSMLFKAMQTGKCSVHRLLPSIPPDPDTPRNCLTKLGMQTCCLTLLLLHAVVTFKILKFIFKFYFSFLLLCSSCTDEYS